MATLKKYWWLVLAAALFLWSFYFTTATAADVTQAYRDFLGRDPNSEELRNWLALGLMRGELRGRIYGSPSAIHNQTPQ